MKRLLAMLAIFFLWSFVSYASDEISASRDWDLPVIIQDAALYSLFVAEDGGESYPTPTPVPTQPPFDVVYSWNMDEEPGWFYSGQWEWGIPDDSCGGPGGAYTGENVIAYNLTGCYEDNMPELAMTTGAINCTYVADIEVHFRRWLGVNDAGEPGFAALSTDTLPSVSKTRPMDAAGMEFRATPYTGDNAGFQISTNGSDWTYIWRHTTDGFNDTEWRAMAYNISDIADGEPTVYLRWLMGPTDEAGTNCGWYLDDIEIWGRENTCIHHGDVNFNGMVTAGDARMSFMIVIGEYVPTFEEDCAADCNGDGLVTMDDTQRIFMTALANDECEHPARRNRAGYRSPVIPMLQQQHDVRLKTKGGLSSSAFVNGDVYVDIRMFPRVPVGSFTLYMTYDREKYEYLGFSAGTLDPGWQMFNVLEAEPGRIILAGFSADKVIHPGASGSLARLQFLQLDPFADPVNESVVTFTEMLDDLAGMGLKQE
jgi:hypothetical protein